MFPYPKESPYEFEYYWPRDLEKMFENVDGQTVEGVLEIPDIFFG